MTNEICGVLKPCDKNGLSISFFKHAGLFRNFILQNVSPPNHPQVILQSLHWEKNFFHKTAKLCQGFFFLIFQIFSNLSCYIVWVPKTPSQSE